MNRTPTQIAFIRGYILVANQMSGIRLVEDDLSWDEVLAAHRDKWDVPGTLTPGMAWDILVNVDDRTSPEEYPEMCLITQQELRDFMVLANVPRTADELRSIINAWLTQDCDWGDFEKNLDALVNPEEKSA